MQHSRGQALTESALVAGLMVGIFFLPIFGGRSLFFLLIDVLQIYFNSFVAVVTLPIP